MDKIEKVRSISLWVFIIPFIALNACLILVTKFHGLFPNQEHVIHNAIPYIDGQVSISRTARVFPTYLIFKPAMFLTSYLLIKYWLYTKEIILFFNKNNKNIKYITFFGIGSAILLILHSVFLGIKFDNELYKLFRKAVMLSFIIFEIVAQAYLVMTYYSFKNHLLKFINQNFLKMKLMLVLILVLVALISIPIVAMPGNTSLKHALEWNYFIGVISFYLLTFFMWKNKN